VGVCLKRNQGVNLVRNKGVNYNRKQGVSLTGISRIAKERSIRQSYIDNYQSTTNIAKKTATWSFNFPMNNESGGLRLKRIILSDIQNNRANEIIEYNYGNGHYLAPPGQYWQSYLSAFADFSTEENNRSFYEDNFNYSRDVQAAFQNALAKNDFEGYMVGLVPSIRLDNSVSNVHYYEWVDEIRSNGARVRKEYGNPNDNSTHYFTQDLLALRGTTMLTFHNQLLGLFQKPEPYLLPVLKKTSFYSSSTSLNVPDHAVPVKTIENVHFILPNLDELKINTCSQKIPKIGTAQTEYFVYFINSFSEFENLVNFTFYSNGITIPSKADWVLKTSEWRYETREIVKIDNVETYENTLSSVSGLTFKNYFMDLGETLNSDGIGHFNKTKRPLNYETNTISSDGMVTILENMKSKNMIEYPIEIFNYNYLNGSVGAKSGTITYYNKFNEGQIYPSLRKKFFKERNDDVTFIPSITTSSLPDPNPWTLSAEREPPQSDPSTPMPLNFYHDDRYELFEKYNIYDVYGNLLQKEDKNGVKYSYQYDAKGVNLLASCSHGAYINQEIGD
jgi:hypothetical protein